MKALSVARLCLMLFCLVMSSGAAQAQISDYERQKIDAAMARVVLQDKAEIFDGTDFGPAVTYDQGRERREAFVRGLNAVIGVWNGLSNQAKTSPEGQRFYEWIEGRSARSRAMDTALPGLQQRTEQQQRTRTSEASAQTSNAPASSASASGPQPSEEPSSSRQSQGPSAAGPDHNALCRDFQRQAMTTANQSLMRRLLQSAGSNPLAVGSVEDVQDLKAAAERVKAICDAADPALFADTCYFAIAEPGKAPKVWCDGAAQGPAIVKAMALAEAARSIEAQGLSIPSVETFRQREGYLRVEGPALFADIFDPSSTMTDGARARLDAILSTAGTSMAEAQGLGTQTSRLAALRQAVEETAATWPMPRRVGDNYSTDLARGQIARMHADARMIDAYLSRGSWKIIKNSLGTPLRRTLPGYIILKRPADPFCQLRPFTLTEVWDGNGYQRADRVAIGYVRFQTCP